MCRQSGHGVCRPDPPSGSEGLWARGHAFTWSRSSCSIRPEQLSFSTRVSEPLYSIRAFPMRISFLAIVMTKFPFMKNSPSLLDSAAGKKTESTDLLPGAPWWTMAWRLDKESEWKGHGLFRQTGMDSNPSSATCQLWGLGKSHPHLSLHFFISERANNTYPSRRLSRLREIEASWLA